MSNCPGKVYPVPGDQRAKLCQQILAAGGPMIDPKQQNGQAETHGVTLTWAIADNSISIAVTSKPWFVSCDTVYGALDKFFASE